MFRLHIETDNDAFADDCMLPEIASILRKVIKKLDSGIHDTTLIDSNGNRVGRAWLETDGQ